MIIQEKLCSWHFALYGALQNIRLTFDADYESNQRLLLQLFACTDLKIFIFNGNHGNDTRHIALKCFRDKRWEGRGRLDATLLTPQPPPTIVLITKQSHFLKLLHNINIRNITSRELDTPALQVCEHDYCLPSMKLI